MIHIYIFTLTFHRQTNIRALSTSRPMISYRYRRACEMLIAMPMVLQCSSFLRP